MNLPAAARIPRSHTAPSEPPDTRDSELRERRRLVLGLAALTMAIEVAGLTFLPSIDVGTISVSPSILPALLLALALGPARRSTVEYEKVLPFWFAIGTGLVMGTILFAQAGDLVDVAPLLAAAADEEIVYRLAVPLVLAVGLTMLRVPARSARVAGYVIAGAWWALLPGHQAQTTTIAVFASYVAFAVLSAVVVSRSRALVAMTGAHAVMNMVTLSQYRGEISPSTRGLLVGLLLLLLVGTFARPGLRRRSAPAGVPATPEEGVDTVIDLRDGAVRPAGREGQATRSDPPALDIEEPAPSELP